MFCIVSDGDHTRYIIPADKKEEFFESAEAIYKYWDNLGDDENDDSAPPDIPNYAIEINGPLYRLEFPSFVIK